MPTPPPAESPAADPALRHSFVFPLRSIYRHGSTTSTTPSATSVSPRLHSQMVLPQDESAAVAALQLHTGEEREASGSGCTWSTSPKSTVTKLQMQPRKSTGSAQASFGRRITSPGNNGVSAPLLPVDESVDGRERMSPAAANTTSLDTDTDGVTRLVNDVAGIVILDKRGPDTSTVALSRDKLASIEQFVQTQAHTTNVPNPNDTQPLLPPEISRFGGASPAPESHNTTTRFKYVETPEGHQIVTGREGEIKKCEDEPITIPGAVQGFGVLMVLEEDIQTGDLSVQQVSENSTEILGLLPSFLFSLTSFTEVLSNKNEEILRDNIEFLTDPGEVEAEDYEGPQVFRLAGRNHIRGSSGQTLLSEETTSTLDSSCDWECWVAASRPQQRTWNRTDSEGVPLPPPNLIILEFELEDDTVHPLNNDDEEWHLSKGPGSMELASETDNPGSTRRTSSHTSSVNTSENAGLRGPGGWLPPLECILESTTNHAKPLRALQGGRRRSDNSAPQPRRPIIRRRRSPDVFSMLSQINQQLSAASSLTHFLDMAVGIIKDVTRFHRVLMYKFDEEMNGKVVSELVNMRYTNDLFKGLMFPAADIPPQARQLYVLNKVRFLYDRDQPTARLVLRDQSDLEFPLDMTHCYLRAMSPIHLKYLENMSVRSSMSVSIVAFGKLWGLIACHSYGDGGMRVSFPVRQMLRILSSSISRNVERLVYAERLDSRKVMHSTGIAALAGFERKEPGAAATSSSQKSEQGYITSNVDDLLQIFESDLGLLVINDGCKLLGPSEHAHAMLAMAEYFRAAGHETIKASSCISEDFKDAPLPRVGDKLAGVLYIPLTAEAGQDFILFFRKGQLRTVNWAGKPYRDEHDRKKATLEPRKSFKLWTEQVRGKAPEWTEDQLESAAVLSVLYGKFIQGWRERQNMMASNHLTSILLSNTSHAIRTPLSQIINTLELAMRGNVDVETRSMLENSHEASRALLFHVHDLLDLTRIETGNETAFNDPFALEETVTDSVRLYQKEAQRRGLHFDLIFTDLPAMVVGDQRKIRTVVSNLVANAVKYTEQGGVQVRCHLTENQPADQIQVEFVICDTGRGMSLDRLEAIFVALEGADENVSAGSNDLGSIGLGLAVVGRIVEQLNGQLRAESEVGKGTSFFLTLDLGCSGMASINDLKKKEQSSPSTGSPSVSAYSPTVMSAGPTSPETAHMHAALPGAAPTPATKHTQPKLGHRTSTVSSTDHSNRLRVLVVEDDMINAKLLRMRLEIDGHVVSHVENGQEAVDLLAADWGFDVVFMDIQMPVMDGRKSAAAIRQLELAGVPAGTVSHRNAYRVDGRIPIFAVSASLYEKDRVEMGVNFDGWLLKPLNYKRVRALVAVLADPTGEKRNEEVYQPNGWERGGFFHSARM